VGRRTISGGVLPAGNRIMFDLQIDGQRFRPTLPWIPNAVNLRRARERMPIYKAQIAAGTFSFAREFPDYRGSRRLGLPAQTFTCSEIFDAFLEHTAARVARGDLAPSTLASYRQILNHTWRPKIGRMPFLGVRYSALIKIADAHTGKKKTYNNLVSALRRAFEFGYRDHPEQRDPAAFLKCARMRRSDRPAIDPFPIAEAEALIAALHRDWGEAQGNFDEFRFFTGLRPSEQIALLVSDFDSLRSRLAVTKARVRRIDREVTKTGEGRHVRLCPRALTVLSRQLRLREALKQAGRINHEFLFFDRNGRPFQDTKNPYRRWRRTLKGLGATYRRPNVARHSSVSWNLMIGRTPLRVAQQHGHSPVTMLSTYAAWTEDTLEADVEAIHRAMHLSTVSHEPHSAIDEMRNNMALYGQPPAVPATSLPMAPP
jgi:integrase